jgi:hypothetical protein
MFTIKALIALVIALAGIAVSGSRPSAQPAGVDPHMHSLASTSFAAVMQKAHP